ncbi:MAG: metallophosphoesterase [Clostridiales bacterium]|nr:metallophosphoesterase [Clostridiales bacterium]
MNKKIIAGSAALLSAGAAVGAFAGDKLIKTTEYTLDTGKAHGEITAVAVSDLHFSVFGKNNCRLTAKVRKAEPDIILLPGDFFDCKGGKSNRELVINTIRAFSEIAPVYFSPGNHDLRYNARTGEDCLDLAKQAGASVLNGEYSDIEIKNTNLRIGGIFDHAVYEEDYYNRWRESEVYGFLSDFQSTDKIKLLMLHRPNTFIYTEDLWNIDAVFSGHDHGGLWRLPFIGGVYAPEQGFFPKYDNGEYDFGNMKMFLCAGLEGYYIVPRLFNPPEILKITIK